MPLSSFLLKLYSILFDIWICCKSYEKQTTKSCFYTLSLCIIMYHLCSFKAYKYSKINDDIWLVWGFYFYRSKLCNRFQLSINNDVLNLCNILTSFCFLSNSLKICKMTTIICSAIMIIVSVKVEDTWNMKIFILYFDL